MTRSKAIFTWLSEFPGLSEGLIHLDFLPPEARSYSICSEPAEPVVQQYMDGSSRRQLLFTVASRSFFGPDVSQQEQSLRFFEELEKWVEARNLRRQLPRLGTGQQALSAEVLSTAYPLTVSPDGMAQYQIQMKLTYLQEGYL